MKKNTNMQELAYWVNLFAEHDYLCFDIIRRKLFEHDHEVTCCYTQNTLLFVHNDKSNIFLSKGFTQTNQPLMFYHNKYVATILKIAQKKSDTLHYELKTLLDKKYNKLSKLQTIKNLIIQPWIKKKAFELCNKGNIYEAEAIANNIIANNPKMSWLYYILGRAL